jgi:hypothetical protein
MSRKPGDLTFIEHQHVFALALQVFQKLISVVVIHGAVEVDENVKSIRVLGTGATFNVG